MLGSDECSSWYNKSIQCFIAGLGIGERKVCKVMDQPVMLARPTPVQSVRSLVLSTMVVECG